jgi:hypothetical protein
VLLGSTPLAIREWESHSASAWGAIKRRLRPKSHAKVPQTAYALHFSS